MLTDNGKKSNQTLRRFDKHFGGFSFKKALNEGIGTPIKNHRVFDGTFINTQ